MKKGNVALFANIVMMLTLAFILPPHSSSAREPKKVAILPFTMNADRDLSFLQEGIMDMLISRLAWKGEVDVLEKALVKKSTAQFQGPLNTETTLQIGRVLKVDYVVLGSLTVFGESVSIDAKILDVAEGEELVTAFNQSKGMDEVIPTVNQFAEDINSKIMGRPLPPPRYEAGGRLRAPPGLIREEGFFGEEMVAHISNYRTQILGLAVADIDGDGENEVLFIDNRALYISKLQGDRLVQIKKFGGDYKNQYLWLDAGDADRDGRPEIYVTNTLGEGLDSFVLEWQNGRLVTLAKGQNWFFRVMNIPGKGETLVGQGRKVSAGFLPGIYLLQRQGSHFSKVEKLNLPKGANALNFAVGDIAGARKTEIILFAQDDRLEMHQLDGEEMWKSDEDYGGRPSSIRYSADTGIGDQEFFFLPSRILLADTDGDGKNEVVVCKNQAKAGRLLSGTRFFTSGRVELLKWQQTGMATFMKTAKISRYISDYQVADVDHDGKQELILAAVKDYTPIKGKGSRSQIIIYDLDLEGSASAGSRED